MEKHLIAIDLDSTVLSRMFTLDGESVVALLKCIDAGHLVVIATARPSCITLPYYRILAPGTPVSTMNGSFVYHPDDPTFPVRQTLAPEDEISLFLSAAEAVADFVWTANDDRIYATGAGPAAHLYFKELFRHSQVEILPSLPRMATAYAAAVVKGEEEEKYITDAISACQNLYLKTYTSADGSRNVAVRAKATGKWPSVKYIADFYGIPTENIVAFGDEKDDMEMIVSSGRGYAMCNGNELVKAAALEAGKAVTEYPCGEGGVGRELEKLLCL